ncbi:P-loop containing nucleoside triphosphate hydrolase protein [Aspergillus desertorum]
MSMQANPEPPDTTFDLLRTSTSSQRLSQIEKIRANGVGEVVDLPQLAVCGDQSAGKSSVLEGTTGMPFPRQEGLCTRFPTEIILRHVETSLPTTIFASIRPHSSRPEKEQESLKSYHKSLEAISELPSTIEEVSRLMGIRGYTDDGNGPAFTQDALRIEIIGSIGLHLSVVDLPGLISVASEEQAEEDIRTVHNIAETYLQSSRTIILAVVQASNDIANQGIIKMAGKYDPDGQRTVGIIAKPDMNQGAEAKIARIAKNEDTIKLKLGFFLLKNPSPTELEDHISMPARSALELRFFSTPVWARQKLDPDRVGVDKLRRFLQQLLDTHNERELPKVRNEIRKHLKVTEAELVRLFLTNLSMKFYELLQAALDGNYHTIDSDFFSEAEGPRLRVRVQEANTKFATAVRLKGKQRVIEPNCPSPTVSLSTAEK